MIHDPDFDETGSATKGIPHPESVAATSCLQWGVIAIFTWWLPLLGQVFAVAGLLRWYRARSAPNHLRAEIGVTLSVLALILGSALIAQFLLTMVTIAKF